MIGLYQRKQVRTTPNILIYYLITNDLSVYHGQDTEEIDPIYDIFPCSILIYDLNFLYSEEVKG